MIPPGEKIIETKKCRISGKEFFVTDKDKDFMDKVSPMFNGKKYQIPSPTLCPEERMKRRLAFRNPRSVYLRKSDATGETIFSQYAPGKIFPVYDNETYYTDSWNPSTFGKLFDINKTFHEQFLQLHNTVPHYARSVSNLVNSDYCSSCNDLKDCYLCSNGGDSEKMIYSNGFKRCFGCMDTTLLFDSRESYMCIDVENCDSCFFSQNCSNCHECWYCDECIGCRDCFSCANLRNKQYHIANQAYGKEEYFKKIEEIKKSNPDIIRFTQEWSSKQIKKDLHLLKTEDSFGNYLVNANNCYNCFECSESQNLRYCDTIKTGHDCMDISSFGWHPEWSYECASLGHHAHHILFSFLVLQDVKDVCYSSLCQTISDCFGCVGLHAHEHHCIFNKPYSVAEYEQLCGKIIDHMISTGEWGEFFPHELSPFGYNETVAQEYFPLTEEEVKKMPRFEQWSSPGWLTSRSLGEGWNWYNAPEKSFDSETLKPQRISEYDERVVGFEVAQKNIDALLAGVVKCEVTGKPFKIIKQELAFYIEHSLPIPTKHPDQRHKERMDMRNPRTLYERTCSECHTDIITTYSPDRPERVVCEECYRKLVY